MSAPDPGFWADIAKWLWGLLIPAWLWMWKKQDDRLGKVEDAKASASDVTQLRDAVHSLRNNMVTREDFKGHENSDRADRAERRETEISLFTKMDELKDSMNNKFDAIRELIMRLPHDRR